MPHADDGADPGLAGLSFTGRNNSPIQQSTMRKVPRSGGSRLTRQAWDRSHRLGRASAECQRRVRPETRNVRRRKIHKSNDRFHRPPLTTTGLTDGTKAEAKPGIRAAAT